MRKVLGVVLVAGLLFGLVPLTVYAVPPDGYAELAAYFPPETPIFMALGTSDEDIARLDVLLSLIAQAAPDEIPPGIRLVNLLDMGALEMTGEDFQNGVRSWLGDAIAFGLLDADSLIEAAMAEDMGMEAPTPPYLVAVDIIDRAAAERAIETVLTYANMGTLFTIIPGESYTVFKSTEASVNVSLVITEDVILAGDKDSTAQMLEQIGSPSLADEPAFTAALGLLPADGYNMMAYANLDDLMAFVMDQAVAEGLSPDVMPPLAYTATALGLTVLDGPALAFDFAQPLTDPAAVDAGGFVYEPLPALDMSFAQHIPANAVIAGQGSDLLALFEMVGETAEMGLAQFSEQMAYMPELDDLPPGFDFDAEEMLTDIEGSLAEAQAQFTAMTGLDFQQDVLRWMDGNFAMFLGVDNDAALADPMTQIPISFGAFVESSDAAASQQAVDGLATAVEELFIAEEVSPDEAVLERSTIGGANVLLATGDIDDEDFSVSVGFGADDKVFAGGTLEGLQAVFAPSDGGLAADPLFVAAQQYLVANTSALFYLNPQAIAPVILAETDSDEVEDVQLALNLFQTMAVSGVAYEDGSSVGRLSIMLGSPAPSK